MLILYACSACSIFTYPVILFHWTNVDSRLKSAKSGAAALFWGQSFPKSSGPQDEEEPRQYLERL